MNMLSVGVAEASTVVDWLWQTTWQASALIVLVFAVAASLGRWLSPGWRYALWVVVAVRLVMPVLPPSPTSVFNVMRLLTPATIEAEASTSSPDAFASVEVTTSGDLAPGESPAERFAAHAGASGARMTLSRNHGAAAWALIACWLLGAALLLGWAVLCSVRLARRVRRAGVDADEDLQRELRACCEAMGVRRAPRLVITDVVAGPALTGVLRPTLLLPSSVVTQLDSDELRYVLRHELAHLRRRDLWAHWLIVALRALHWFNPLVWLAARHVQNERELACDALVLSRGGTNDAPAYGRTLIKVIELMQNRPGVHAALGIGGSASKLKRRLSMLKTGRRRGWWIGVMVAAALVCIGLTNAVIPGTNSATAIAADGGGEDGAVVFEGTGKTRVTASDGQITVTADRLVISSPRGAIAANDDADLSKAKDAPQGADPNVDAAAPLPAGLTKLIDVDFKDAKLVDVIAYLRQVTGENFLVQWPHLESNGRIVKETSVTMTMKQVRAVTALQLICESLSDASQLDATPFGGLGMSMGFRIDDGVVVITSIAPPEPRKDADAEARTSQTREALRRPIDLSFEGNKLSAVVDYLRNAAGINIMVHWNHLAQLGVEPDSSVSMNLKKVPVGTALRLILEQVDFDSEGPVNIGYRVEDGVVVVSRIPSAPTVQVDARFMLMSPEEYDAMVKPMLTTQTGVKLPGATLDNTQLGELIQKLAARPGSDTVSAPRLTTFAGQPASVRIGQTSTFVSDYKKQQKKGEVHFKPVIMTLEEGLTFEVTPKLAEGDDKSIGIEFESRVTSRTGPTQREPFAGAPKDKPQFVEAPQIQNTRVTGKTQLQSGLTYLVDAGELTGKLNDQDESEYGRKRHMIVVITPKKMD
ncbi:MAG: hypothetical protein GC159_14865 [Phycisphaera sp.]|nr:hypothetical protein [Phycisphaera sp.]